MGSFLFVMVAFFFAGFTACVAADISGPEDPLSARFAASEFRILAKTEDVVVNHRQWNWQKRNEVWFRMTVNRRYQEGICEKTVDARTSKVLTRECRLIAGPFVQNN